MKTCECGGKLYRHGQAIWSKSLKDYGTRYICANCKKTITVRQGQVTARKGMVHDWRMQA